MVRWPNYPRVAWTASTTTANSCAALLPSSRRLNDGAHGSVGPQALMGTGIGRWPSPIRAIAQGGPSFAQLVGGAHARATAKRPPRVWKYAFRALLPNEASR